MAFARRFFSCKSNAPQLKDTTTEPRRIIDTIEIIASLSLSATKYAKSAAERKIDINILEIIATGTTDSKRMTITGSALRRHIYRLFAGEIIQGDR